MLKDISPKFALIIAILTANQLIPVPAFSNQKNKSYNPSVYTTSSTRLSPIKIGKFNPAKIELQVRNSKDTVSIIISGVGSRAKFFQELEDNKIITEVTTPTNKAIFGEGQSLSIPTSGIKVATLSGSENRFKLEIITNSMIDLNKIKTNNEGRNIVITMLKNSPTNNVLKSEELFNIKPIKGSSLPPIKSRAIAPPLGDIAIGTTLIPNPNLVQIEGPEVSLVFKQTQAKHAIEYLMSKVNYGFVWVQKDPAFDPDLGRGGATAQSESSASEQALLQGLSSSSTESSSSEESNADSHRYLTLSLKNVSFSNALNSVLLASGLQARLQGNILYVGPNVRETVFETRISRVYRLNQTTANAAASYLANLGAKVTKTSTLSTAITQGATQSESVGASSSTTTSGTTTEVEVYGSDIGPLLGLIATTDDRLQTVTMVGSGELISVAEGYLKQLDLRQRQVALTVRILDIQLDDGTAFSNSWAFKQNDNFIVNDKGTLLGAFGAYLPPDEGVFGAAGTPGMTTTMSTTPGADPETAKINTIGINPARNVVGGTEFYRDNEFLNFLKASIVSKNTKILANPTLILNEYPGKSGGETVAFGDISSALSSGSIGRSYGNEGFVIIGNQVPINCTASGSSNVVELEYGIAGLTFGARVSRIDDNGFVTFSISPAVSAPSSQMQVPNCGVIDLLSVRRLDSGSIRVRDGHTLILTGVINSQDKETITKIPVFGDLPIIGQFFRDRVSAKEQRELVILVTPHILDGGDMQARDMNNSYSPASPEAKVLINKNL